MNDISKGLLAWALIFAAGLGTGWMLWGTKTPKVETYAQAVTQQDGSQILERKPQADAKPAQQVPKGAKVERVVQVVVQPSAGPVEPLRPSASDASAAGDLTPERPPCPPVRVDLTLVRMPDQTRRVLASSPDGKVVSGIDIPVETAAPMRPLKWAAGVDYTALPWGDMRSLVAQRTWGPVTIGGHAGVATIAPPGGGQLRGAAWGVTALIRF